MLRDVRLAALEDAPYAFGSTHAAEVSQPDEHWSARARLGSAGSASATFLAMLGRARVVGVVGGYRPNLTEATVELVSMWTHPLHRRGGTGRQLVASLLEWARATAADSVELWVTAGNEAAIQMYRDAGFRETAEQQPLPRDRGRHELRMRYPLD